MEILADDIAGFCFIRFVAIKNKYIIFTIIIGTLKTTVIDKSASQIHINFNIIVKQEYATRTSDADSLAIFQETIFVHKDTERQGDRGYRP